MIEIRFPCASNISFPLYLSWISSEEILAPNPGVSALWSKAIPTTIKTYRTAIRTACATRETEIDNCADTAALVTLYGVTTDSDGKFVKYNMTQYPVDPNE